MQLEGKLLEKIKVADKRSKQVFQDAMSDASTVVMEASIREAPGSTGKLRQSIRRDLSESGLRAEIYPSVKYGEYLHGPFDESQKRSAPHLIPAREAQEGGTLYRWAKKKGANPWAVRAIIAKRGSKFNPYLKTAAEKSEPTVKTIFERSIEKVAQFLGD